MTPMGKNANQIARMIFDLPQGVQEDLVIQVTAVHEKYGFPAVIDGDEGHQADGMDYSEMEKLTASILDDRPHLANRLSQLVCSINDLAATDPHGELMDRMELLQGFISRQTIAA